MQRWLSGAQASLWFNAILGTGMLFAVLFHSYVDVQGFPEESCAPEKALS